MRRQKLPVAIGLLALATPLAAQTVTAGGQVRPRFENRDTDGAVRFTSMRVRAHIEAGLERDVRVFIQLQDVRLWGEEGNTLTDFRADNFDLHQGYLEAGLGDDAWLRARIGRQETNLGGQRLVGAVGWVQQGRSFDGLRVRASRSWGTLDFLGYTLSEQSLAGASDAELFGAYGVVDVSDENDLDLYALHTSDLGSPDHSQTSLGARFHGSSSRITYRGELTYQTGERAGQDVSAYMFGARAGTSFNEGRGSVTLWYDYLSGDDDPGDGEVKVFDTMFATNHKYYGFADLFLNIPAHTGGLGLQDIAIKTSHRIRDATRVAVDLHRFSGAQEGPLADNSFGQEIDITLNHRYAEGLGATVGLSQVFVGDGLVDLGRFDDDVTFFYIMLDASF